MKKKLSVLRTALITSCSFCFVLNTLAQPTISSLSTIRGYPGSSLTITGTSFDATASNNLVQFGSIAGIVTSARSTSLTVTVPMSADYDYVSVENMTTHLIGYSDRKFLPIFDTLVYSDSLAFASYEPYWNSLPLDFVFVDDLDRDGKPDMLMAEPGGINVYMYRNATTPGSITPSSLTFGYLMPAPSVSYIQGAIIGDVDGDGKPDLATLSTTTNKITVQRNISTPGTLDTSSFDKGISIFDTVNAFGLALGDLDGDGKPDLVFTHTDYSYNQEIGILANTSTPGSISFAAPYNILTGGWGFLNRGVVTIADIDGDGKPDLVLQDPEPASGAPLAEFYIYRNTSVPGSFSFDPPVIFGTAGGYSLLKVYDVEGDGKPDIIVKDGGLTDLSIYRNTATAGAITTASLAAPVHILMPRNFIYDFADMDGDCKPDLVTAMVAPYVVSVNHNLTTPGSITTSAFGTAVSFPVSGISGFIGARDIDGDSKPELIAGVAGDSIAIFRNIAIPRPTTNAGNVTASGVSVYPNPASNEISINWGAAAEKEANVTITDIAGRTVCSAQIAAPGANTTIPLSTVRDGMYILSITTAGASYKQQLLIRH